MLPDAYTAKFADIIGGDKGAKDDSGKVNNNASYLNYPNIFNIKFEGPLATKIDGFLPAVCANAQVDYTGGQKFSTFYDGQPSHIQLTLNFLEIQTMTLGNYETQVSKYGDGEAFAMNDSIVNQSQYLAKGEKVKYNPGTGKYEKVSDDTYVPDSTTPETIKNDPNAQARAKYLESLTPPPAFIGPPIPDLDKPVVKKPTTYTAPDGTRFRDGKIVYQAPFGRG